MNILHLSDTTLSGSPIRIVNLINKHSTHKARHIAWTPKVGFREFQTDVVGSSTTKEEVVSLFDWADVIHYHNRYKRQNVFTNFNLLPPKKPSVIQIHSPRESEDFSEEVKSKIPIAVIAQYHVRQWPEAKYIVPNVVDITELYYRIPGSLNPIPIVSYAPSNCTCKDWNDKGYSVISPILKRLKFSHTIYYQLIVGQPHHKTLERKLEADIGVDEIVTGSYHLSSLEYMAMGIPCFCYLDDQTTTVVKKLTGAEELPWINTNKDHFGPKLLEVIKYKSWQELGNKTLEWMKLYWNPAILSNHYIKMYEDLK